MGAVVGAIVGPSSARLRIGCPLRLDVRDTPEGDSLQWRSAHDGALDLASELPEDRRRVETLFTCGQAHAVLHCLALQLPSAASIAAAMLAAAASILVAAAAMLVAATSTRDSRAAAKYRQRHLSCRRLAGHRRTQVPDSSRGCYGSRGGEDGGGDGPRIGTGEGDSTACNERCAGEGDGDEGDGGEGDWGEGSRGDSPGEGGGASGARRWRV